MMGSGSDSEMACMSSRIRIPFFLHSSCRRVLTMRSGLSSRLERSRISASPSCRKKSSTASSTVAHSISCRSSDSALLILMRHLTARSKNRPEASGRWRTSTGASRVSSSSAVKAAVRSQFSSVFSISTFRAFMRLPPSWISNTRESMRVSSMAATNSRSVSAATERASRGRLHTRISRLTVYLHRRCGAGLLVRSQIENASMNIVRRRLESMATMALASRAKRASDTAEARPSIISDSSAPSALMPSTCFSGWRSLRRARPSSQAASTASSDLRGSVSYASST
mmetsp:Transcript_21102/g.63478  ORF Transcript_21102/g.63478 Transcript_21102/m.63478 type:complete len:284 (-) Transcript_21102:5095-5946(-)